MSSLFACSSIYTGILSTRGTTPVVSGPSAHRLIREGLCAFTIFRQLETNIPQYTKNLQPYRQKLQASVSTV